MTFGKRIYLLRQKVCKTQKVIEAETGIPQRTLSDWENDKSEPRVSELLIVAKALEVPAIELLIEFETKSICSSIRRPDFN